MSCVKCSICFLLLSTAGFLSCEEEGNTDVAKTTPTVEDQVTFGGNSYALKDGLLRNYGATDNHYNIRFSVTDGEFTSITTSVDGIPTTVWMTSDASVEIVAALYSPGNDSFRANTFGLADVPESAVNNANLVGGYFFNEAYAAVDVNADGEFSEDERVAVSGGAIQITGTYPEYIISYDLTLANGSNLRGAYGGPYALDENPS